MTARAVNAAVNTPGNRWWAAVALATAALPAGAAVTLGGSLAGLAVVGGLAVFGLMLLVDRDGSRSLGLWLFVTAYLAPWVGIRALGVFVAVSSVVGVLVVGRQLAAGVRARLTVVDLLSGAFLLLAVLGVVLYGTPPVALRDVALLWVVPYLLGRLAPARAGTVLLAVGLTASALSVFEFLSGINVFSAMNTALNATQEVWNGQQVRGADIRSEASFGHAIALGATIALTVPWAVRSERWRWPMLTLLTAGVLATVSRGPLIALAVALVLSVILQPRARRRPGVLLAAGALAAGVVAALHLIVSGSAADQIDGSDEYRILTIQRTVESLHAVGIADDARLDDKTGNLTFSGIYTVDNAYLLVSLEYGVAAGVVLLVPLLGAVWPVLRGRAAEPTVAMVGQIPVIAVTAPITQWQVFLFFVAGMAVTAQAARRASAVSGRPGIGSVPRQKLEVTV